MISKILLIRCIIIILLVNHQICKKISHQIVHYNNNWLSNMTQNNLCMYTPIHVHTMDEQYYNVSIQQYCNKILGKFLYAIWRAGSLMSVFALIFTKQSNTVWPEI